MARSEHRSIFSLFGQDLDLILTALLNNAKNIRTINAFIAFYFDSILP